MSDIKNMEIEATIQKRFLPQFERYEPIVKDHSAVILAKECLRKYFYRMVLGFEEKEHYPFFAFGSAYHKFREILEITKDIKQATMDGFAVWKKDFPNDPPVGTKWDFLTLGRLALSFKEAYGVWQKDQQQGVIRVIATEQSFDLLLPSGRRVGGRADQVIRWNGKVWGLDFKTTSKQLSFYDRSLDPNNQFSLYTWAEEKLSGERVYGQLVEVLFNTSATKSKTSQADIGPKIQRFMASRSPEQMVHWLEDFEHWLDIIDQCRERDNWPMSEANCGFCKYHSVCKQPTDSAIANKLQSEFEIKPWDHRNV